jgi:agmatinase
VLPLPYEKTTSYKKGTKYGPSAIISALNQVEFYDEEIKVETHDAGIHVIPEKMVKLPFNSEPEKFLPKLSEYANLFVESNSVLISLGGEHSITFGLVKPFRERYKNLSVLHLDAHSDLRDEFHGTRFSHAAVMRRVSELCPVTQVGIRSLSENDFRIMNKGNITTFLAHEMRKYKLAQIVGKISKSLTSNVYLSIDLDVFDPAYMPGVGTPEPGGLSWYEILDILRPIFKSHNIVGIDIVELCPLAGNNISEFTAAKLLYRLIGYCNRY